MLILSALFLNAPPVKSYLKCPGFRISIVESEGVADLNIFVGQLHVFFIRKKFIRKSGSNRQNLKKIVRKSRGSNSKIKCFYRSKIGNFVVIAFKMLKIEFKFKYAIVLAKV